VEEILSALLDISRLDAGATRPDISSFAIGELLQALAVEMAPAAATGASNSPSCRRASWCAPTASCCAASCRTAVERGEICAGQARAGGLPAARRPVRIEVHDTGCGIPDDKLQTIFVEFERLQPGDGSAPGLGLGLSIVERIARMLDHALEVRSEMGRGSMFATHRAAVDVAVDRPPTVDAQSRPPAPRAGELAGTTVLVVDNEEAILQGMQACSGTGRCG
jgi:signal transduction histidine kinase